MSFTTYSGYKHRRDRMNMIMRYCVHQQTNITNAFINHLFKTIFLFLYYSKENARRRRIYKIKTHNIALGLILFISFRFSYSLFLSLSVIGIKVACHIINNFCSCGLISCSNTSVVFLMNILDLSVRFFDNEQRRYFFAR